MNMMMTTVLRQIATIAMLFMLQISTCLAQQSYPITPLEDGLTTPYLAPEITGITGWINSGPLSTEQLRGNVILVHFWSSTCLSCIDYMPTLINLDEKYRNFGLVIIGVHRPLVPHAQDIQNIESAVKAYNIQFPIALDNNGQTAANFNNQIMPEDYLIDKNGYVVYINQGGGNSAATEYNIRLLLGLPPTQYPIYNGPSMSPYPVPPPYGYGYGGFYPGQINTYIIVGGVHHRIW